MLENGHIILYKSKFKISENDFIFLPRLRKTAILIKTR